MKKIFILLVTLLIIGFLAYPEYAKNFSTLLVINMDNKPELPQYFREEPELQASGSGQFSEKSLDILLNTIPSSPILIIDLRKEPHGFLNGTAVSWYGSGNWYYKDKTIEQIEELEKELLQKQLNRGFTIAFKHKQYPWPLRVNRVATEDELVRSRKARYLRLPITDHVRPSDVIVDRLIAIYREIPKNTWVHFHCSKGRGRTSTVLTMIDILKNGDKDSLETIVARQEALGGLNLLSPPKNPSDWKASSIHERTAFIKKFYSYVKQYPNLEITWSDYVKKGS